MVDIKQMVDEDEFNKDISWPTKIIIGYFGENINTFTNINTPEDLHEEILDQYNTATTFNDSQSSFVSCSLEAFLDTVDWDYIYNRYWFDDNDDSEDE